MALASWGRRLKYMKGKKYSETKARTSRINYDIKKGLSRELALERERMRSEGKKPPRFVVSLNRFFPAIPVPG